jgi:Fur family transcriptional regulator, ferric uptake regulator
VKHAAIVQRFEVYLRSNRLKLTPQRRRVFERVFATHEHFSAETLFEWLRAAGKDGPAVSRATVYRTLDLLERGGFVESLDTGQGGLMYEHVLGHHHHDHMVCVECGGIEEFHERRIEELQAEAAMACGFTVTGHVHRLSGICRVCTKELARKGQLEETLARLRGQES